VDKFYLSHLVYAGRGDKHRGEDTAHDHTRRAMDLLIDRAWAAVEAGEPFEVVTGNNDADAVYFLRWAEARFPLATRRPSARASGGLGRQFLGPWGRQYRPAGQGPSRYLLVGLHRGRSRTRRFREIWTGDDPILATLRTRPRPLKGRCGACAFKAVCGGNTRIRALQVTGDPWAEDPACYLTNAEIGVAEADRRVAVTPFRGKSHDPAHRFL
jgi:radical SAM protein with 4Fe4S-binding SPASM domain